MPLQAYEKARGNTMNYNQYISADPEILGGKPRIADTRISVGFILEQLSLGDTIENLLEEYDLTREQILAALAFASERMYEDRIQQHAAS